MMRRAPSSGRLNPSLLLWFAGLMIAGFVLPVFARKTSDGMEMFFWWDIWGEIEDERRVRPSEALLFAFFLLPPLLGVLALFSERWFGRHGGRVFLIFLGVFPLFLIMEFVSEVLGRGGPPPFGMASQAALPTIFSLTMLASVVVAVVRPKSDLGYRVAGVAAVAALMLLLLPISPDVSERGRKATLGVLNLLKAFDLKEHGFWVFLVGALGFVTTLMGISLLARDRGRSARARATLWLFMASYALGIFLPFIIEKGEGSFGVSSIGVLSFVLLRVLPGIGLAVFGLSDLMLSTMSSEKMEAAPASGPDAKTCCRRIKRAHDSMEAGAIDAEEFRKSKVKLLRQAVQDAKEQGSGEALVGYVTRLRELGAINDVEYESVVRAVQAT